MKSILYGLGGILALALGGIGTYVGGAEAPAYGIGDVVSDFSLKTYDGKTITLSEYAGANGCIIVFTCNTCPYAKLYEDRIIELQTTFQSQGFPVLAINPNDPALKPGDSAEEMQARAEEKSYPFPYVVDDQGVHALFGATKTPQIYILDKNKKVQYIGAIDDNAQSADNVSIRYVADAIAAIKEGKAPSTQETRAIGCTIKPRS